VALEGFGIEIVAQTPILGTFSPAAR
jgi:hypothetical protein